MEGAYARISLHFQVKSLLCKRGLSIFLCHTVHSDRGLENIKVAEFMLAYRGFDRGSMITGSSVHNQGIERLWRDMFRVVILPYYRLFYSMEYNNILNPSNDTFFHYNIHTYLESIEHYVSFRKHGTFMEIITVLLNQ